MAKYQTITSANSIIMLSILGLFPVPQQIFGFAADTGFNTEAFASVEVVMGVDGKNARRLTALDSEADEPSWSPDSRKIVFVSTRDGFRELYVMNADGSGQKRLTFQRGQIYTPAWSPYLPAAK